MQSASAEQMMERVDDRAIDVAESEVIAVFVCRNESLRLPFILDYYRRMGVDRFFIVDNASTDGFTELALAQPDTHVYRTTQSYREARCGLDWSKALLDAYGDDRWCLVVDADEMVIFPGYEHLGFRELAHFLDEHGAQGLLTFMLDMYSREPLRQVSYRPGQPFLEACCYFDRDSHYAVPVRQFPFVEIRGGARERAFFDRGQSDTTPPPLKKIPFIRWKRGMNYTSSTHFLEAPVVLGDMTGVILHFKFFQDAPEAVKVEVDRGQRWNDGAQYRRYSKAFSETPEFTLHYEGSEKFRDSLQLVELGLMRLPWEFPRWLEAEAGAGTLSISGLSDWIAVARELLQLRRQNYCTQYSEVLKIWPAITRRAATPR